MSFQFNQNGNTNSVAGSSSGINSGGALGLKVLSTIVENASVSAKTKLAAISNSKSSVSIADMFDLQMLMNQLSQLSEMSTAVISASNSAIQSMARNIKS